MTHIWTADAARRALLVEIARWGGYMPPTTSLDRRLVNAVVRHLAATYKDACGLLGAKKRPRGMRVPPAIEAPAPEPAPLDYDACYYAMERDLWERRLDERLALEAKAGEGQPERHVPKRSFRQFTVDVAPHKRAPTYLPPRYAVDLWHFARRDAA